MEKEGDELFEVKNCYYLGNYQGGINEGLGLQRLSSDALMIERDSFVYRCYIAQGNYQLVLDEIKDSAPAPLQAVKLLATYLKTEQNKDIAMVTLKQWLSDGSTNNKTLLTIAGILYSNEGNLDEALRCLHQAGTLESSSLKIHIYLRMNRIDLAEKELREMQKIDDDATLTQLAAAWINLTVGGERLQEAYYSFTELMDKHSATTRLLNGLAICSMHSRKFEEAEKHLLEALEKNPKDAETIANLITCYVHLQKPRDLIARYLNQIKSISSGGGGAASKVGWINEINNAEDIFNRSAQRFVV